MERNLWIYGSPLKPHLYMRGAPRKMTPVDEKALLTWLSHNSTAYQDEMAWFLWEERGVLISRAMILRVLKRRQWLKKKAHQIV